MSTKFLEAWENEKWKKSTRNYGKHSLKSKEQPGPLMNFIIASSTQTVKKGETL